jgi:arginine deiminase
MVRGIVAMRYGCQSMVGEMKSVLLKHPREAFISPDHILAQWKALNYSSCPDFEKALVEYDKFAQLLEEHIPDIYYLPQCEETGLDSIYAHDSAIITNRGAILCSMGKKQRRGEPLALAEFLQGVDVPILGSIVGDGRLECGDVVWIDDRTIAVGRGYRTNENGIRQLQKLTADFVDEIIIVELPHWKGYDSILHLLSLISPIDSHLALVYSKLLPVGFRQWLINREIKLLEVPDHEYEKQALNVLAVAPRKCIMLSGNDCTRQMLESEGVEVWEFDGEEISLKGTGGPTCLTRPILRQ